MLLAVTPRSPVGSWPTDREGASRELLAAADAPAVCGSSSQARAYDAVIAERLQRIAAHAVGFCDDSGAAGGIGGDAEVCDDAACSEPRGAPDDLDVEAEWIAGCCAPEVGLCDASYGDGAVGDGAGDCRGHAVLPSRPRLPTAAMPPPPPPPPPATPPLPTSDHGNGTWTVPPRTQLTELQRAMISSKRLAALRKRY